MKLCKDCFWCSDPESDYPYCLKKVTLDSTVTGKEFCRVERMFCWPLYLIGSCCGKRGRFWVSIAKGGEDEKIS